MSDAVDKPAADEYAQSELVDAFSSVHINVHGDVHGKVQSNAATANCNSQSPESTASAGSEQFAGDETGKREPFERNFQQFKETCSNLYTKIANQINNYLPNKTGIPSSGRNNLRDERTPVLRPAANHNSVTNCNRSNVSSSISSNPLLANSHSPQDSFQVSPQDPHSISNTHSPAIDTAVQSGAITGSNGSTQPALNRNLAARSSSRSILGSANESQQFKMTRDQLSPTVNAQCLSPRPRPKECTC